MEPVAATAIACFAITRLGPLSGCLLQGRRSHAGCGSQPVLLGGSPLIGAIDVTCKMLHRRRAGVCGAQVGSFGGWSQVRGLRTLGLDVSLPNCSVYWAQTAQSSAAQ